MIAVDWAMSSQNYTEALPPISWYLGDN
jgi:hypothetical protein